MPVRKTGYFRRLTAALLGRDLLSAASAPSDETMAELRAIVAALEMELKERDDRIQQMRAEYKTLEGAKQRMAANSNKDELEKLFKRLSGPLANLTGLTSMAEAGDDVEVADLVQLIRDLEKVLAQAGLEQIGTLGEQTEFDVARHQRISGGRVNGGTQVTVRLPGYRLGEKVLIKAMVSTEEEHDG